MPLTKFESMLKTNSIYFFDLVEFEEIIIHYIDAGKHSLAKKAVKLGLEQHSQSVDLKLLRVELYIFENELDKASSLLKRVERLEPNNDEVFIQKATISSKTGNHKEAIIHLQKALTFTDDKVDIWSFMGMEFLYLDNFENARLNFAKCVEVDFEDYSSLYNIVYCFDMEKKHEAAIIYLNNYIDRNPYCEVAWHQLGRQHFILEMYEEALVSFDYAVLIDESFIGGYLEKAKTLEALERYQEAIDNYLITLELDDPTAFAYVRIGECYERIEKYEAAVSYYKKAVHEDPLLDRGWILLTNLFFNEENYEKASYYISKALKIDEDNSAYWRRYSEIKLKLNFFEEAVSGFENCLALNDDSLEIYIGLTDVLSFLGEFNDAVKILYKAQKTYKNLAEIEYRLAGLFFILNKEKYGFNHLISGMKIDYNYHVVLKEIYPTVLDSQKVQKILVDYKKANE
ncbi:tetratricopeptide repeat protein [Polaribacter ponticola]|uniref:Tetratricopeptide repeat protein n=1 Tax=Polaribacter ponticola TaxID=2978475 RepID=A0ABT5S8Z5_9FLAO|nr:tetratricopeptide repeat protein [Polaribacter sp. MSW5]MDD7914592.1 tetratricopeptide repeat protein [Polaribacter sp. MSW5]